MVGTKMAKNSAPITRRLGIVVSPLIFIVAIIIRLVIAGATFHVDLNAFVLAGGYIKQGNILSFYDQVRLLPAGDSIKNLYSDKIFNYQPLSYLIPSLFYLPLPDSTDLRQILSTNRPFEPLLILYKLPFIFFDILAAIFIVRLVKDEKKQKLLQLLWLFNPVAIFVSSFMGQSDIMVAFFLLLALISLKDQKIYLAVIFTAISALFKPAGLLLMPLIAISILPESLVKSVKILTLGLCVYFLGILPYLSSVSFRTYALLAEQTGKSTFAGITIASGTTIPWFFIAYTAIVISLIRRRLSLFDGLGLALAGSLVFSHFHPQWFVWLMPWLIYKTSTHKLLSLYLFALGSWFLILLSFDYSLHLSGFWWLGLVPNQYLFVGNELWRNLILASRAFLIPVFLLLPNDE